MILDYDSRGDVLCVYRNGAVFAHSSETPHDGCLVLSYDATVASVGVTLIGASVNAAFWPTHPDRGEIPPDLLAALDAWIVGER